MNLQQWFGGGDNKNKASGRSNKASFQNQGNGAPAAQETTPLVPRAPPGGDAPNNNAAAGDKFYFIARSPGKGRKISSFPADATPRNAPPIQTVVDGDYEEAIPSRPVVMNENPKISFWKRLTTKKIVKPQQPAIKIEPKIFFSNERTFVAWLHAATMLAGGSLAIVAFSEKNELSQLYGLIMLPVAIIFLTYALFQYGHRSGMIRRREAGPYDDVQGAVVLSTILMISICATFGVKLCQMLY